MFRVSAAAFAASLTLASAANAGVIERFWGGDSGPDIVYFEFYDAKILEVEFFKDSNAYDIDGFDYSVGGFSCVFPGSDSCSGPSFGTGEIGRIRVSGGRMLVEFFGWPSLPDGYLLDGALALPGVSTYYTRLRVVTDGPGNEATYYEGSAGPIPEPATWSLMIAGFGLAGFGLRRTRAAAVASHSPTSS
ncbi:PEPxxWA-CTERM sorting domain-containing protein [Phenylobacterium sp.]|uniref:PEPxxWA-CTERM sorting domain-containing protein n=1 Tax=Phenylobacterium sp. TaxID=1871053 RepID=UPI003BAAB2B2